MDKRIKKYFKFPIFVSNYKRFWSKFHKLVNNQLKVDRIYRDKHGEKKKIKICVNLVNPV